MTKFAKAVAAILTGTIMTVTAGAGYIYSQRDALIQKAVDTAAEYATKTLGTKVEIGSVVVGDLNTKSNSDITVRDLAIYDNNSELIAKAETADVSFHLLTLYKEPLSAIDEINLYNVEGNIIKRNDNSWNFSDIKTSSDGESDFDTNININSAKLNAEVDGHNLSADIENVTLDFDTTAKFSAQLNNAKVDADIDINQFISNTTEETPNEKSLNNTFDENDLIIDEDAVITENESPTVVLAAVAENADIKNITAEISNASLNFDHSNIKASVKAQTLGTNLEVDTKITDSKQIINVNADNIDVEKVLDYIPNGTIPDGLTIHTGQVSDAKINVLKRDDNTSFSGSVKLNDVSVTVEQTDIENIDATAQFTDAEILLDAFLQANGQQAQINGSIRIDTDEPYFNLKATSDSFNPNAIMYLPAEGTAAFNAHLTGTASNPIVEADIDSPYISYDNLSVSNVSTHLKYQNDSVYLSNINANIFGGTVTGEAELQAMDLSYNAHLKIDSIAASRLTNFVPDLNDADGLIFADIGINGINDDFDKLKVYGSATISDVYYNNVTLNRADTSFYVEGDDVKIDFLSAELPNNGSISLEGTITDANKLDLKFYGGHIDLNSIKQFIPQVNVSGLADFSGSVHGDIDNPDVQLKLSAVDSWQIDNKHRGNHYEGILLDQPYDSIKLNASGSLDGVEITDFNMVRDGKDVWIVKGKVGLTGDKNIDLQVDTVGARAEDIIRLAAPDQPLTGNVDNIIKITGTIDKPEVVGYIHFWRGSYRGMLVNGMDGDYYVDGNTIRLQDFHINSPMVDMDLNGTIDSITTAMDFVVTVHDIDVHRFQGKLPENYPAHGHGKFDGIIKGNLENPIFDGTLVAEQLSFNGVAINDVDGHINLNGNDILLDNFSFNSDGGTYKVHGKVNYVTNVMNARSEVHNADIAGLLALANIDNTIGDDNIEKKPRRIIKLGDDNDDENNKKSSKNKKRKKDSKNDDKADKIDKIDNADKIDKDDKTADDDKTKTTKKPIITGRLDSDINFGGTLQNPFLELNGTIQTGTLADCDIHDINLNLNMLNNIIFIKKLEGYQGTNGNFKVVGSADLNGPLDIHFVANNLENAIFTKAANLDVEAVGNTNIEVDIGGFTYNPSARGELFATGGIKGSTFDLLRGNFELSDNIVNLQEFTVQRTIGDKLYKVGAKGLVPLVSLTADKTDQLTKNEMIDVDISLDNADLSLLPILSDYVSWAVGEMKGNIKVTGTPSNPYVNGSISVVDGTTKIKGMKSLIEHQNMLLAFKGNRADIETFTGQIGGGTYNLAGGISFEGVKPTDYNFELTADKLGIKCSFFEGPLSFQFTLNEDQTPRGVFPKIAGHIDLDNCLVSVPTIPESESEMPNINLDVSINLGDKVHFYSSYLYDMYLTGSAQFHGSTTHPMPSGTISVKRGGTLSYLKTLFNIREGEAHFNQPESFFPTIKFSADTKLVRTKVYLNIDGSLNSLKDQSTLRLTSSPEMAQTEIIQLLTLRDAYQKGGDNEIEAGDILAIGLQMSFLSEIEAAVRKSFGFDQFAVSRGSGSAFDNRTELRDRDEEEYNVSMGKYITDNVMLKYTRGIGGDNINRYGFQYDFNDNMGATIEREGHANIFGFEARWKFN